MQVETESLRKQIQVEPFFPPSQERHTQTEDDCTGIGPIDTQVEPANENDLLLQEAFPESQEDQSNEWSGSKDPWCGQPCQKVQIESCVWSAGILGVSIEREVISPGSNLNLQMLCPIGSPDCHPEGLLS